MSQHAPAHERDSLYVHESGDPDSPAVVFLHGAAVSGAMWRDHMVALSGYHCLAPDMPGHGQSNDIPWRSLRQTADLVATMIETRVPSRKASVVGLSMGGAVTHVLLGRRPDLLDRVIIDGAGVLGWWGDFPFLVGITAMAPFLHTSPVVEMLSRSVGGMPEADKDDVRRASRMAFWRGFVESFSMRLTPAELTAPCPTLLVSGEHEANRPSNAALASLMPNAIARYVPGAGHGWLSVKPELHRAMVEAWLAGDDLPAGLAPETTEWSQSRIDHLLAAAA